jgi:hypothetical protein
MQVCLPHTACLRIPDSSSSGSRREKSDGPPARLLQEWCVMSPDAVGVAHGSDRSLSCSLGSYGVGRALSCSHKSISEIVALSIVTSLDTCQLILVDPVPLSRMPLSDDGTPVTCWQADSSVRPFVTFALCAPRSEKASIVVEK